MRREGWQSSRLSWVSIVGTCTVIFLLLIPPGHHIDMLTPIDQPLDKLADLRSDELYVPLLLSG